MSSAAILCVARNETPFTEEWLEYHFSLGIDRVYYVSTDPDFDRIKSFFDESRFRSRVDLQHFDDFTPGWQARCYNTYLPLIEEEWVLVIDLDEFLYLGTFSNIGAYLNTIGSDISQVQFPWLVLMSENYSERRVLDIPKQAAKYISDHVKSMVRRDCIARLGIHSHRTHRLNSCLSSGHTFAARNKHSLLLKNPRYFESHPVILHFFSRGHLDVMSRILDHRHFNTKSGEGERSRLSEYLNGPATWSSIPNRYMIMKFMSSLPTAAVPLNLPLVQAQTDVTELERLFIKYIDEFIDLKDFNGDCLATFLENRYRLAQKLSGQDLSREVDLDDYQKCRSQLEYVSRLRTALLDITAA